MIVMWFLLGLTIGLFFTALFICVFSATKRRKEREEYEKKMCELCQQNPQKEMLQ